MAKVDPVSSSNGGLPPLRRQAEENVTLMRLGLAATRPLVTPTLTAAAGAAQPKPSAAPKAVKAPPPDGAGANVDTRA